MTKGQKVNYIKVSYIALTAILIVAITTINVNFNQPVLALQNITSENQTGPPNVTGAPPGLSNGNMTGGAPPPAGLTAALLADIVDNGTSVPDNTTMSTP
jgi:hypothetical protein